MQDPDKKPFLRCFYEFIALSICKKEPAYYYFKHLYKKQIPNIYDYLSTNERAGLHSSLQLNPYEYTSILKNKLNSDIYFRKFGLRMPKLAGYNIQNHFYAGNRTRSLKASEEVIKYFSELMTANKLDSLFLRPIDSLGGKGCHKLHLETLDNDLIDVIDDLFQGSYVYTEVIHQHPDIDRIHSASVNTLRLITFANNSGNIKLLSAAIRFGVGDGIVHNLHSGGFLVGIDLETGVLDQFGWKTEPTGRGELFTHHPGSGKKLEGFRVPFFKEACALVIEATQFLPKTIIGWDVAIQEDGPVIIEGNHTPTFELSDLASKGLLKDPDFKALVKKVKTEN
jgi:hypothetical protein